jgi:mannose-6-phosphate isomerase-like protein (cupin superfamily)
MTEEKIFELEGVLSQLEKEGGYFLDFLKVRNLEAGVILLHPGENDTQGPHAADELYYVIEGSGSIELGKKTKPLRKGSVVFVPAGLPHRFRDNKQDLVVLYVFSE